MKSLDYLSRRHGSASFGGKKVNLKCSLPVGAFEKGVLLVGDLEELECETPLEDKVNAFSLVTSKNKPLVVAGGNGELVIVVSSDNVELVAKLTGTNKTAEAAELVAAARKRKRNPAHKVDIGDKTIQDAVQLHTAFHGTEPDNIKKVQVQEPEYLVFFGHLNFIVYSVPNYSERRGVPFIHEARDRGDDVPPSKDKPIICISPNRDYLVMYGTQFEFTERGIIG